MKLSRSLRPVRTYGCKHLELSWVPVNVWFRQQSRKKQEQTEPASGQRQSSGEAHGPPGGSWRPSPARCAFLLRDGLCPRCENDTKAEPQASSSRTKFRQGDDRHRGPWQLTGVWEGCSVAAPWTQRLGARPPPPQGR